MDNMSQALIIAGAVMIGVLLLSIYNRSMNNTEIYTNVYTRTLEAQEIQKYNAEFESNAGIKINMYEVVSLMNKALYINKEASYNENKGNYIHVDLKIPTVPTGSKKITSSVFTINTQQNNDILKHFESGSDFDYKSYQSIVYGLLREFYDSNEHTIRGDASAPYFKMNIEKSLAGYVCRIKFTPY